MDSRRSSTPGTAVPGTAVPGTAVPGTAVPATPAPGSGKRPELTDIDLSDPEFWGRPPAEREAVFTALRAEQTFAFFAEPELPFIETGAGYYAVVRHGDIDTISSAPTVFCSGKGAVSIPDLPAELVEFYGSLISMDDPRHSKIRRIVSRAFSPRLLADLVGSVELLATQIVTRARAVADAGDGTFDFVREIAAPLPLAVICQMMGIPEADRPLVLATSTAILSGGDPEMGSPEEVFGLILEAGAALAELIGRLAAERAAHPTDDLTSALVTTEIDGEHLSVQEIASFFILLCVAGNETTRNAITHGLYALQAFPDQRARWLADPSLTRTAVEEIVRWASPVTWMRRTATQDVVVAGQQFLAGDKFVLFYNSANRDESVFADADTFDLGRDPNPHYGFGAAGPHFCLGANLARREIAVAFATLFELMPDLVVVDEPDRLRSSFVNGIKHLTVRLTGAS